MFALHRYTVLVAAFLTAAVCAPARSVEVDRDPMKMEVVDAATSPGPVIARKSLATEVAARADASEPYQPTRAIASAARRLTVAAIAPTPSKTAPSIAKPHRPSLILGIGY